MMKLRLQHHHSLLPSTVLILDRHTHGLAKWKLAKICIWADTWNTSALLKSPGMGRGWQWS